MIAAHTARNRSLLLSVTITPGNRKTRLAWRSTAAPTSAPCAQALCVSRILETEIAIIETTQRTIRDSVRTAAL